jgi:hypothetical protein
MKEEEALFGKKKGTSGKAGAGQKRVIEGWIWSKYITYMYENVIMKSIIQYN